MPMPNRDYRKLRVQIRDVHQALHVLRQNPKRAKDYAGLQDCLEMRLNALETERQRARDASDPT